MAYKQKGWSPFTQCSPGGICRPSGRRTNKWRHKWNKLKANVGEVFEKKKKPVDTPKVVERCPGGCFNTDDSWMDLVEPYKPPPKSDVPLPPIDWDSEVYN